MTGYIVVFITVSSHKEAKKIARVLIEKKLAACVNIISGVSSIYHWQGKIEESREFLLMAKTTAKLWPGLVKEVVRNHSYDTPEVISFAITKGLEKYLAWINKSLNLD